MNLLMDMVETRHTPVMLPEVLSALQAQPGGRYIDATCGEGGHARALLKASAPGGQVMGIDADSEGLAVARGRLAEFGDAFLTRNVNFVEMGRAALEAEFAPVHGVLFDLGLSSLQLDVERRGFSFRRGDPLDMRFSVDQRLTAAEIVNFYSKRDLADILFRYGDEGASHRIAEAIVSRRPLSTSLDLAEAVVAAVGKRGRSKIHPATRTFQAIRIAVNSELSNLPKALKQAMGLLGVGGRLAVISYHSLEDRIVKNTLRREAADCACPPLMPECVCDHRATIKLIGKGVTTPSEMEVKGNPRSRSAKLRVAERI